MYQRTKQALEAVDQLLENGQYKNATELAELESGLSLLGLDKLAGIVRDLGIYNAGNDYIQEYNQVLQAKIEVI